MAPDLVKKKLQEAYPESTVEVFDPRGSGDFFEVYIESSAFSGMSRIQQHQHVMSTFDAELKSGEIHALQIKTKIK